MLRSLPCLLLAPALAEGPVAKSLFDGKTFARYASPAVTAIRAMVSLGHGSPEDDPSCSPG